MDINQNTSTSGDEKPQSPNRYISTYLRSHSEIYRELSTVQEKGWSMASGDKHFQKQRQTADNADAKTCKGFFSLMQRIGDEMHKATGVMCLPGDGSILDLCKAPGGYSASALKYNPQASISGATLPVELGGHEILLRGTKTASINVWYGDFTSLIGDMGINESDIPHDAHPNIGPFQRQENWPGKRFDLVFCDGQVLRNHLQSMPEQRSRREATRLTTCSQLLISLRHVRVGGSVVVLLHKLDAWNTVATLRAFDRFANVEVLKPRVAHRSRGSVYLVAKDVVPECENGVESVREWMEAWMEATFSAAGGEGEGGDGFLDRRGVDLGLVKQVMDEIGGRLIELGERAWRIQREGIEGSSWYREIGDERDGPADLSSGVHEELADQGQV